MSSKATQRGATKALRTLQPSADQENQLIGRHPDTIGVKGGGRKLLKSASTSLTKLFVGATTRHDAGVQTGDNETAVTDESCQTEVVLTDSSIDVYDGDSPEEIRRMLTASTPSLRYMELLAESRRRALEETLAENRQLYRRVAQLEASVVVLTAETEDGRRFKQIVQEALDEEEREAENQDPV